MNENSDCNQEKNPISGEALLDLVKTGRIKEFGVAISNTPAFEMDHFKSLMDVLKKGNAECLQTNTPEPDHVWHRAGLTLVEALHQSQRMEDLALLASLSWESPDRSPLSIRCLDAAVEIGPLAAVYEIGHRMLSNTSYKKGAECGAHLILKTAEAKYDEAYYITGELYMDGTWLPRDLEKARTWLWKSALQKTLNTALELKLVSEAYSHLSKIYAEHRPSENRDKFISFFRNQARIAKDASDRISAIYPGEELSHLVQENESKIFEKKSSLRFDVQKKCKNTDLEHEVLKTIGAFLNTEGGVLIIGADDEGNILGIEDDLQTFETEKQKTDHYRLHIQNLLFEGVRIPPQCTQLISINFFQIQEKTVCQIIVGKGPDPIFMKTKHGKEVLYVRREGATIGLEKVSEITQYCLSRWGRA